MRRDRMYEWFPYIWLGSVLALVLGLGIITAVWGQG